MTSSEIVKVREIRSRLVELAERLDNQFVGTKPITKKEAAVRVYGLIQDLKLLLGD